MHSYRFVRFVVVGLGAVGLNLVLFWLLVGKAGVPYLWAAFIIFCLTNGYGFWANRRWVYQVGDRPGHRLALYFAIMGGSLILSLGSMAILVSGLGINYLLASALSSAVLAPVNYLAHGRITFHRPRATRASKPDLVVVTNYYPGHGGGVELVADQVIRRLTGFFDCDWYATGSRDADGPDNVTFHPLACWNGLERKVGLPLPIPSLPACFQMIAGVRQADLVWLHDLLYPANLIAALAALAYRKPLAVTVHVGAIPYRNRFVRMLMSAGIKLTGRLILTRADVVAFVSVRIQDEFLSCWRLRRSELVPNGLDHAVFAPIPGQVRESTRAELDLDDRPVLLFVGRFVERKGLPLLRILATQMPQLTFVFAGQGPLDPDSWLLDNVRVVRDRRDARLAQLYGAADMLVLPSVGEGFPLVVEEALAVGLPVLIDPATAAGYPAVASVLEIEPVEGADAPERWVRHISSLLADRERRRTLASAGAIFARAHWDWDHAARLYADLFESLLPVDDPRRIRMPR